MTAEKRENIPTVPAEEQPEFNEAETADEHQVYLNVAAAYKEAETKRKSYKKYGPLAIFLSGLMFLLLIIGLDSKIDFLIMWVVAILFCAALMIRAEYKYYKFRVMLGLSKAGEDGEEDAEEDDPADMPPDAEDTQEENPAQDNESDPVSQEEAK